MNITTANNPISEVFHFDGYKQIRTMFRPEDDAVLFCGKDVAEALGYKDTKKALAAHVDEEDKELHRVDDGGRFVPSLKSQELIRNECILLNQASIR